MIVIGAIGKMERFSWSGGRCGDTSWIEDTIKSESFQIFVIRLAAHSICMYDFIDYVKYAKARETSK